MDVSPKPVEQVTVADLRRHPVWEFILDREEELGETHVRPVTELPVGTLGNRVVGTQIRLNNGTERWAILANVWLRSARQRVTFFAFQSKDMGNGSTWSGISMPIMKRGDLCNWQRSWDWESMRCSP